MNLYSLFEDVSEEKCPHCNGPMFSELMINEKKDACYYKVKSRYKVWPSAYASGALVKCRKKGADSWGNKSESVAEDIGNLGYNVVRYYEKTQEVKKLTNWLEKEAGLPRNSPLYFDDVDLVYGNKTIVPGALINPKLTFNDLLTAVVQASKQGMAEATGDERFDTMMGRIQQEPKYPDSQMPPTDVKDLYQWAVKNNKPYHKIFAEWAMREGYKSVAPALQKAGNLDSDALDYWTPRVWKIYWGEVRGIDSEMPPEWAKKRIPAELRYYLDDVFDAYDRIVFDWPTEYRQIGQQGVSEGSAQEFSIHQLASISDEALDNAYGYGRSSPGNSFGWQANLMSAAYAKKMIDAGVTDIEQIANAIHKGWNVTAHKFVQNPDQFDDTEKLRQAGKLDAKLQQRAKLMKINYAQLDNDEQEKDRVVARALLQTLRGKQGMAEDQLDENLRQWFKEKWVRFGPDGKIRGDCARGDDSEGKPKCLPQAKAHALGKKGRASAAARKRREDPNPERRGPAHNVATKSESSLNEFAPLGSGDGDDGFSDETLKRLAAEWWQGDEDPRVERTLAAAGWEIGQDEGYDNGGVFVVMSGDEHGRSYMSWPAEELEGLSEGYYNDIGPEYGGAGKGRSDDAVMTAKLTRQAKAAAKKAGRTFNTSAEYRLWHRKQKEKQGVAEAQTDYQKRRQRERDVDAGKPVKRQPKNPQNDYFARRKKERDLAESVAFDNTKKSDRVGRGPLRNFNELAAMLKINDRILVGLMSLFPGFPKPVSGIRASNGSHNYYRPDEFKRWVIDNGVREYIAKMIEKRQAIKEDQAVQLSPNISARPNQDPDSPEDYDYFYKDMQVKPGQDFHTQIKDQHLRQMDPAYNTMRAAFDNPIKPGPAIPYKEPKGDTIIPSRPQEPEIMKDLEGNPVRLKDYVPGDPRISESRLYYRVIGTADKDLRSDFGMRKDNNGWYLKESSSPKYKMMAQRAFGSPKLKEYNFPAGQAVTGSDNVISPVGSVPRNQINKK